MNKNIPNLPYEALRAFTILKPLSSSIAETVRSETDGSIQISRVE